MLAVWAVVVALQVYVFGEFMGGWGAADDVDRYADAGAPSADRQRPRTGLLFILLPAIAALYGTTFLSGLSAQYKRSPFGKISNVVSCFISSRILDFLIGLSMILVSGFFVFMFLSLGSFGSASILLFIVAFFFSLLVASGFNWLLHLLVFGQSRGNEDEWFMAHFLGHLLGFGLVILALVLAGMAPPPSVPYVAAAGLWLSALPHLWLCYRVWRDHYEAERQLVETVRYADRFLIAAGVLAVIALAFHVATDFRVQPVAALYFLT